MSAKPRAAKKARVPLSKRDPAFAARWSQLFSQASPGAISPSSAYRVIPDPPKR